MVRESELVVLALTPGRCAHIRQYPAGAVLPDFAGSVCGF